MRAKLTRVSDLTDGDLSAWRDLAQHAVEPNPFHEPAFLLPLTRSQDLGDRVSLLTIESEDGWHAALPVQLGRWHRIPLRSMSNYRGPYSFLGTPLARPDHLETALGALVDGMRNSASSRFVALDWVADDGPLSGPMRGVIAERGGKAETFERFSRAVICRGEGSSGSPLSSKSRSELRRMRRKLGEQLGEEVVTVDRSAEGDAYDDFLDLEASGWKGDRGTAMRAKPEDADFFRSMCREFAQQGRLRLLFLQAGTRAVAAQCDLVSGDTLFGFKVGYGAEWSRFSPGMQLLTEVIERFRESDDLRVLDSCADPGNKVANRLLPDRRALASFTVRSSGIGGAVALPALGLGRRLRERRAAREDG